MSDGSIQDDFAWKIRFSPESDGLTTKNLRLRSGEIRSGEYDRSLSIRVDASRDHGLMTVPIRLPRYLMPQWSTDDWIDFIDEEIDFFNRCVDECTVQYLSLAIVAKEERKREILKEAEQVVIDFRGDLPNRCLALMLGGYKVGVNRKGHDWPIWLSIQPTYDLAIDEGMKIRKEANISKPNDTLLAIGALTTHVDPSFVKSYGLPILSSTTNDKLINRLLWIALGSIFVGIMIGWWLKVWFSS